jgi:MFS family permease
MSTTSRNPRLVLFAFCAITVVLGIEYGGFQLSLLGSVNELGFDSKMIGLPVTMQFVSACIMPLAFGPLSDRIGKRMILAVFMIVFCVGSIITWQSISTTDFLFGIFLIGAGFSICECLTTAALSDVFPGNEEKYINVIGGFFCVGAVASPLVLQWIMDSFSTSWRVIFLISAVAMAAIIPFVVLSHITPRLKNYQKQQKTKLEHPFLLLGFILCMFVYIGIESCFGFFADTVLSIELSCPYLGAYAISIFWTAMGIGRFYFGRIKNIHVTPRHFSSLLWLP